MEFRYKPRIGANLNKLKEFISEIHSDPELIKIAKKFIVIHNGKVH